MNTGQLSAGREDGRLVGIGSLGLASFGHTVGSRLHRLWREQPENGPAAQQGMKG